MTRLTTAADSAVGADINAALSDLRQTMREIERAEDYVRRLAREHLGDLADEVRDTDCEIHRLLND